MLMLPPSTGVKPMKNLSFFVSAFALCASTSYAAINCGTLPSCASLGYTDTVSQCPKSSTGAEMVVKCPFDTTQGKCIREAAVGQIAYFSKAPNAASGWLLCDGNTFTKTKYPELYTLIGQQFCNIYNGGTCGTDVGRLPKYTGMFLRVYGSPDSSYGKVGNTSFDTPQKEGLPNITGGGGWWEDSGHTYLKDTNYPNDSTKNQLFGAYYLDCSKTSFLGSGDTDSNNCRTNFDASRSNTIYGAQSGVTPPNMAVYAYIYAGKIAQ